jgi:hypothetical protein
MQKSLKKTLLLICQGAREEYPCSKGLEEFCEEYGLGRRLGTKRLFQLSEIERIKGFLMSQGGMDWRTDPDTLNDLTRAEASKISNNEKDSCRRVRDERVAIKTLVDRPLQFSDGTLSLPPGSNLDVNWRWVAEHARHDSVLVIENWECFEDSDHVALIQGLEGNPLVLYRGDPVYQNDNSKALLEALGLPVFAFVDYDPQGIVIAKSLPGFVSMIAPPTGELDALVSKGNSERFALQISGAVGVLDNLVDPSLQQIWSVIKKHGKALPQERLVKKSLPMLN